jgi:predicted enzyme related to lactoylglutathione lyase
MGRPVVQWQILSKDPRRTADFYSTLFDWEVKTDNPLSYRRVDTRSGKGIPGGIWPAPPDGHNMVQLFIEVADVSESVEKAREGDEMAIVLDPMGIPFGLVRER